MNSKDIISAALGALLLATVAYVILTAPGLLDDGASTVPAQQHVARVR